MKPMRMRRAALVGVTVAIAAASTAALAASPASAADSLICGVASGGSYSYSVTSSATATSGHNKKAVTTTTPQTGLFKLGFSLSRPSCRGSSYAITISSTNGSLLGWATTKANSYVGTDTTTPDQSAPAGATAFSADGLSATVTFAGDGLNQTFVLEGTTGAAAGGYTDTCVASSGAISNPDGTSQASSHGACSGGGGGTSYW